MRNPVITAASLLVFANIAFSANAHSAPAESSNIKIEEIVVLANHISSNAGEVGSTITAINTRKLARRAYFDVSQLLRTVPNTSVNRAGPLGALTQVRIRGAEANHTLVLIDGVEVNDVANGSEFNFAHLAGANIDRIEVLRGAQSARFGADTIGGVIGIFTNQRTQPGIATNVNLESGSFNSRYISAGASAYQPTDQGSWNGQLNISRLLSDGYSASPSGSEKDGFEDASARAGLGYRWNETNSIKLSASHSEINAQGDEQDFNFPTTATQGLVVDALQNNLSKQQYINLLAQTQQFGWQQQLSISHNKNRSRFFDTGVLLSGLDGEREKFEFQISKLMQSGTLAHSFLAGVHYEGRKFENIYPSIVGANYSAKDRQHSLIGEYVIKAPSRSVALSVRADNNQRFDNSKTVRLTLRQKLTQRLSLHSSWGEGIANPTFFELFGFTPNTFQGNPKLKPEESKSWDLGVSGNLAKDKVYFDLTYFSADLSNEITTVFDMATFKSSPENQAGKSKRRGLEISLEAQLGELLSLSAHGNILRSRDPDGREEVRRPEKSGSISANVATPNNLGRMSLQLIYNGESQDNEFIYSTITDRATLKAYSLVNLSLSYDVQPNLSLYLRADNLLNEDYQEVYGYQSSVRGLYAGFKATF